MMRLLLTVCLMLLLMPAANARTIKTAEDVVRAMHDRYAGKWYRTLTFTQKSTEFKPDGTSHSSIWYEALMLPGKLRIVFEPVKDGNGLLFVNDTQHVFKDGKPVKSQPRIHPLLLLGFDVYGQSVAETLAKLHQLKFDLGVMHEDRWQGRSVYVVGAAKGDLSTPQFWIDKKNLYFVRLIEVGGKDGTQILETQFNKYIRLKGGGWVAPEVVFMADGKRVFLEEYSDIRSGVELDAALFDVERWSISKWR